MDNIIKRGILAYMNARCEVSSQHKLPCREELHGTVMLGGLFKKKDIDEALDDLISSGKIVSYGGYLSDHVIDVL